MVGKATSVNSGGAGMDYAMGKDQAEVIDRNGIGAENGSELKEEFEMYQEQNLRCERNNINLIISPSPEDAKTLNNEQLRAITTDFMKKMKLEKHQYIAIKHTPKDGRVHVHIYANRIDENGKAYKDNFIGKKAQHKASEVARERGLIDVKEIRANKQILAKENLKEIRSQIFSKHTEVMIQKPKNFENYSKLMKEKGVEVVPSLNKKGAIQGFRVKYQGFDLKATQVHRDMSLSRTKLITSMPKTPILLKQSKAVSKALDVGVGIASGGAKIALTVAKGLLKKGISHGIG